MKGTTTTSMADDKSIYMGLSRDTAFSLQAISDKIQVIIYLVMCVVYNIFNIKIYWNFYKSYFRFNGFRRCYKKNLSFREDFNEIYNICIPQIIIRIVAKILFEAFCFLEAN